ncbi:MAG: NodT family efflux transporter outer membrane factor (OMF) lipoprotein [Kiritimatiellia bacterium]|jgi:outer membrane protein, multidrug efflux system
MQPLRYLILSLLTLALVSCKTTSSFSDREALALPEAYVTTEPETLEVKESLLALFGDEALRRLVDQALEENPELLRVRARMEELGFNLQKTSAARLPVLSANGAGGRQKRVNIPTTSSYTASLDVRWEVDVWGRIRSGVSAAEADQASAVAAYDAARQSLAAQTMKAWFQLVATEKTLDLNQRRIDSFSSTFDLVQRRFELGNARLAAVELARTDLENARADIEASQGRRDQAARQLRVLVGAYPDADVQAKAWPALNASVPAGLPSDLLRKRPDVLAAYEAVRAADARVQVAHADLFPSFALTGSAGRGSDTLSDLVKSGFDIWSIAGNLSTPLFEAGRRQAEVDAAGKRAEQAFYSYQSTVINALREVEDALGSETFLAGEERARLKALVAARAAEDRSRRDYEAGVSDILSLLETQRRVFTTEQQSINIRAARLNNRVALALALGKGT